ncbi:hypothetical protein BYT27DRAFT_7197988 [Phlegmacium glaucopus]|nr:hypothetical protein BYT27DRAFT_7197988 [Phlegmacium glaucopus]
MTKFNIYQVPEERRCRCCHPIARSELLQEQHEVRGCPTGVVVAVTTTVIQTIEGRLAFVSFPLTKLSLST